MGIYLADQTQAFLQSCLTGMLLGLLFDAFRISRIAVRTHRAIVFVEDVLFFLLCAIATFLFLMRFVDGQVRSFLLAGEALGAVFYFCTVGQLVMGVSKKIIAIVKALIFWVVRWVFRPIWLLFYGIVRLLLCPLRFIMKIFKKFAQKLRFRLKKWRVILYNHYMPYLCKRGHTKPPGDPYEDETQRGQP